MSKKMSLYSIKDIEEDDKLFGVDSDGDTTQYNLTNLLTLFGYPSDDAWTTVTSLDNGWTGTVRYILRAGRVTVVFEALKGSDQTSTLFITLPDAYKPAVTIRGVGLSVDSVPDEPVLFSVATTGGITAGGDAKAGTTLYGSLSYPVL
jgi:hypothetical protein